MRERDTKWEFGNKGGRRKGKFNFQSFLQLISAHPVPIHRRFPAKRLIDAEAHVGICTLVAWHVCYPYCTQVWGCEVVLGGIYCMYNLKGFCGLQDMSVNLCAIL